MKPVQMQRILGELRELQSATRPLGSPINLDGPGAKPANVSGTQGEFGNLLAESINQVNQTMLNAQQKTDAFVREEPGASLVEAMVAMNEAQVSFRYVVEVRNRLIQAYQDIANMPV